MQIEFVTHASVIYRHDGVQLLCDPWLEGTAFDDGWALLSPPVLNPAEFERTTHIWFSHEHPDHFSPRSLMQIPEHSRKQIKILFHSSEDSKIREFCDELGFGECIELQGESWVELCAGFDILCDTWEQTDDSWLLVRSPEATILNLNDCQINSLEDAQRLRDRIGPIDTLLTQFSISSWDGNEDDLPRRLSGARSMVERSVMQTRVFEAKQVVPFASFIWFCHTENTYMNTGLIGVGEVARSIETETDAIPIVMYPGDTWVANATFDSQLAITRYENDISSLQEREPLRSQPVTTEELKTLAGRFRERLHRGISPLRQHVRAVKLNVYYQLRTNMHHPWRGRFRAAFALLLLQARPARIWLTDTGTGLTFDLRNGLKESSYPKNSCDIELSSAALAYAFKFLWGGESLQVNGRFKESHPESRTALFDYFWMASVINHTDGAKAKPL